MGKAWAKIKVKELSMEWYVSLISDLNALGGVTLDRFKAWNFKGGRLSPYRRKYNRKQALARARAWSRRLGGIPVEVEE